MLHRVHDCPCIPASFERIVDEARTKSLLHIMGGHVFTDGTGGAEDPGLRRCGRGVTRTFSDGGLLNTLGGRAGILHGRNQSVARAELLAAVDAFRLCSSAAQQIVIWTDCMFVVNGFAKGGRRRHLCHARNLESSRRHRPPPPLSCSTRSGESTPPEAEIAARLISPFEACGNEAWSLSRQPATQTSEYDLFKPFVGRPC